MKVHDFNTGTEWEIDVESIVAMHSRGNHTEITVGLNELYFIYKGRETVPEVYDMIRGGKRK